MLRVILICGLVAVVIIAVAASFTRKTFHVEAVIAAPPEVVWAVLVDTSSYPDWNPVFVEVEGTYAEGAKLLNKVRDPSGNLLEMTATVTTLVPARELRQKGGIPGFLTFDHQWLLEAVPDGTKIVQHEVDRGIGLWFLELRLDRAGLFAGQRSIGNPCRANCLLKLQEDAVRVVRECLPPPGRSHWALHMKSREEVRSDRPRSGTGVATRSLTVTSCGCMPVSNPE